MSEKQYRLPREFAVKWLEALRSGKYVQGTGSLCRIDDEIKDEFTYCCLGVAAKIIEIPNDELLNISYIQKEDYPDSLINDYIQLGYPLELLELDERFIKSNSLPFILGELNDKGKSFKEIADWIESNIEFYD